MKNENKTNVEKYPIDELYYLRYDLRIAEDAGEKRHPSEVIKELGGKELAFDGCPIADCDFILAQGSICFKSFPWEVKALPLLL